MTARAGDTVTIGIGYDGLMERKLMSRADTTVTIVKDDQTYTSSPPLRAVFQLYPDPDSKIANYEAGWLPTQALEGNPYQTVVVLDLPPDILPGMYNVTVRSPHLFSDFTSSLEIIPGTGSSDSFTDNGPINRDITKLERVPTVTVTLDSGYTVGALSMLIDFNEDISAGGVAPTDINVHLPRYVVGPGKFQDYERMIFWEHGTDANFPAYGEILKINILCPKGVVSDKVFFDLVYPSGAPNFSILSQKVYDTNGDEITGVGATMN